MDLSDVRKNIDRVINKLEAAMKEVTKKND